MSQATAQAVLWTGSQDSGGVRLLLREDGFVVDA